MGHAAWQVDVQARAMGGRTVSRLNASADPIRVEVEQERAERIEEAARKACEAEFTSERLAAMNRLREALDE